MDLQSQKASYCICHTHGKCHRFGSVQAPQGWVAGRTCRAHTSGVDRHSSSTRTADTNKQRRESRWQLLNNCNRFLTRTNALVLSITQQVPTPLPPHTRACVHVRQHWIKTGLNGRYDRERKFVKENVRTQQDSITDCPWKMSSHQITKPMLCLYQTVNVFLSIHETVESTVCVCVGCVLCPFCENVLY